MKEEVKKNKTSKKGSSTKVKNVVKKEIEVIEEVELEEENTSMDEVVEVEKVTDTKKTKNKGDLFLILGLVVVVVLGFLVMSDKNAGPTYELPLTLSGEAGLQQLTYAEYQDKIDNGDEFVVILERATCSHCVTYMPVAEQFASDNSLPMYYVDTDTFTEEDWTLFEKSNSYLKKANGNWGTPTTLVLSGSQMVDYIEGATDASKLLDLYNEYFDMGE